MMHLSSYKHILWAAALVLLGACTKEAELPAPTPVPQTKTIPYSIKVQGVDTRSTIQDDLKHVFEPGDRIYVESEDGQMYGFLSMPNADGVGESTAVFEGDLTSAVDFTPVAETPINLTLVGPADDLHTIVNGKLTGMNYTDKSAPTLAEAVRRYAHFTGSGNFGDYRYTLQQNSSFLVCVLSFDEQTSPVGTSVTATIVNNSTSATPETIHAHTGATTVIDGDLEVTWVIPFASGTSLTDARMTVSQSGKADVDLKMADQALAGNSFYTFQRTTFLQNYLTIEAIQNDTKVTFNYATAAADGIQYSRDGFEWHNYLTSDGSITLQYGEFLYFRGKRTSYRNDASKALFKVDGNKPCYVYGDLMFLTCDAKFKPRRTAMPEFAFRGLFKNCTWLRIDGTSAHKPLTLSATTLSTACYHEMFLGCTGLDATALGGIELPDASVALAPRCFDSMFLGCTTITTIPEGFLPYTQLAFACYRKMFEGCTKLVSVPSGLLPALTLAKACYIRMFYGCTSITIAPDLMATTPTPACYFQIFRGCVKLAYVKCLMLLSLEERVVYANPNDKVYDNTADPPVNNLEIWDMISTWSVFNKWLVTTDNKVLNTNPDGVFIKHKDMTYNRTNAGVNWMGVVPEKWQMSDYPGVIDW